MNVLKCILMRFWIGDVGGEFRILHPKISKHIGEAVPLPR
jgi:hypothetical protein